MAELRTDDTGAAGSAQALAGAENLAAALAESAYKEVFEQGSDQLQRAGYSVVILNDCLAKVSCGKLSGCIKCDAPRVEMGGVASRGGENAPAAAKPGA